MCIRDRGEVLVEKDTLLEKKATDAKGTLTFDSDLPVSYTHLDVYKRQARGKA